MQLQINRGEGRHQLARCLFFANQGAFQSGDYEEMMNKATCLSLLSNAVLIWNTMHMTRIIEQLRASGETIAPKELSRIWLSRRIGEIFYASMACSVSERRHIA
jgi:TnpA family transposase